MCGAGGPRRACPRTSCPYRTASWRRTPVASRSALTPSNRRCAGSNARRLTTTSRQWRFHFERFIVVCVLHVKSKAVLHRTLYCGVCLCCILVTVCSNEDYCRPVLCLESEAKNPFPLFSRILWHAREGMGCKHILRRPVRRTDIKLNISSSSCYSLATPRHWGRQLLFKWCLVFWQLFFTLSREAYWWIFYINKIQIFTICRIGWLAVIQRGRETDESSCGGKLKGKR